MKIIALQEGSFTVDSTKQFIPFNHNNDKIADRSPGSLLVEIQPFLVVTSKDIILLDAGLGFKENGQYQIVNNINLNGIGVSEVTKVFLSHLHKDHIGGIYDEINQRPVFESATYYVQRAEWERALSLSSASYQKEKLLWMENHPNVQWLDGAGIIDSYIKYEISGGHCLYHQTAMIIDEGEIVFYGGDEAPQLQQMKHRFVAKYDADGKRAMQLRQEWMKRGEQDAWTFLFYHDIKYPSWKF